jgi:hypothetical protein
MFDNQRRYELVIRPLGRNPADEYLHEDNIFIEGREGNSYTIDLRNHTNQQALFILSVDGLDVLEGKPAGLESQGYIVPGYGSVNVPGWKLNNKQAAEFYFSRSRESYVNQIGGQTTNTGVVGVLVISEAYDTSFTPFEMSQAYGNSWRNYRSPPMWGNFGKSDPYQTKDTIVGQCTNSAKSTKSMNYVEQDVGTGFGGTTNWKTVTESFRRANPTIPDTMLAIYYNTAKNLEKMGIRLRHKRDAGYMADPFPSYSGGCKPPPDRYSKPRFNYQK